jgi:hypothetical protein
MTKKRSPIASNFGKTLMAAATQFDWNALEVLEGIPPSYHFRFEKLSEGSFELANGSCLHNEVASLHFAGNAAKSSQAARIESISVEAAS